MEIENPMALHFMMQDDLFILKEDRGKYTTIVAQAPVAEIVAEETPVIIMPVRKPEFTFKGKKGGLLVLVNYADQEFIHETHLAALENILKRKNVAVDDIAILNVAKNSMADLEGLFDYFKPEKILVMGEQAFPTGMTDLTINQPLKSKNTDLLYSFSFEEMMDSPENKKAFWDQMKNF